MEGTVQGVGFRPSVFRLARELGLAGFVRNDEGGVLVEVEGGGGAVERFVTRLPAEAPPLARIERLRHREVPVRGETGFRIAASTREGAGASPLDVVLPPDTAPCDACLAELFDLADRRHRYPFVNCTHCGPRYTLVRALPYDRPATTMARFPLCPECRREYEDPADRRFHAEPIACPACGPRARLADRRGRTVAAGEDPVRAAAAALGAGKIVAVKGVGGFQLACRADDETVVARLRERKRRPHKPLAVMVRDLERARALVEPSPEEEALLASTGRPIVLVRRRGDARIAAGVAPGLGELGILLPSSPLHELLLADAAALSRGDGMAGLPLVMTSGNLSGEPLARTNAEALERLGGVADLFLVHDRPIHCRADDSVVRVVTIDAERRSLPLRRARGFVPAPLELPVEAPEPILAVGGELKSTFCLAAGRRAWVGPHVGDLGDYDTQRAYREALDQFRSLLGLAPRVVAHDVHPDYRSTAFARDMQRDGARLIAVQHHHAHLAACLAEHGETGPAVGALFDGTGYGPDGTLWGGELLVGGLAGSTRAGHLLPVRLPGGDRAVREPWRMALSWMAAAGLDVAEPPSHLGGRIDPARWRAVAALVETGTAAPWTTSMGRLFDAVAALAGLCLEASYEGQAAIALEAATEPGEPGAYALAVVTGPPLLLDPRILIPEVLADARRGVPASRIAARFHRAVAETTATACTTLAEQHRLSRIALSGGVFQNRRLLELVVRRLAAAGLHTLVPRRQPPNDGGLAYGQAAVAAACPSLNIRI